MSMYLAGPMTGIEGFNYNKFDEVAKQLRDLGHEVVSPAEIGREISLPGKPGDLPYADYVKSNLKAMLDCDELVLLPRWRGSRGARMEVQVADFTKMKIWQLRPDGGLERMNLGDQEL